MLGGSFPLDWPDVEVAAPSSMTKAVLTNQMSCGSGRHACRMIHLISPGTDVTVSLSLSVSTPFQGALCIHVWHTKGVQAGSWHVTLAIPGMQFCMHCLHHHKEVPCALARCHHFDPFIKNRSSREAQLLTRATNTSVRCGTRATWHACSSAEVGTGAN